MTVRSMRSSSLSVCCEHGPTAAGIFGNRIAGVIQLVLEYDPQPPYAMGSTAKAPTVLVEALRASDLVVEPSLSR